MIAVAAKLHFVPAAASKILGSLARINSGVTADKLHVRNRKADCSFQRTSHFPSTVRSLVVDGSDGRDFSARRGSRSLRFLLSNATGRATPGGAGNSSTRTSPILPPEKQDNFRRPTFQGLELKRETKWREKIRKKKPGLMAGPKKKKRTTRRATQKVSFASVHCFAAALMIPFLRFELFRLFRARQTGGINSLAKLQISRIRRIFNSA